MASTRTQLPGSEPYDEDNLLDRLSRRSTLEFYYDHQVRREAALVSRRIGRRRDVLSVGCGWHPGRDLFPPPESRITAVDASPAIIAGVVAGGTADDARVGYAGRLDLPAARFDVVLYRRVLHHIAYKEALTPCFEEAARLLRSGGALVAIEPGLWHPVGLTLAAANASGLATAIHGTPDDVPLSPRRLIAESRAAGLAPELHAVTYSWRRLVPAIQALVQGLDALGSRPRAAMLGHTLLLIARKGP